MEEKKTVHHKKRFSEEEALENVEKKLDEKMDKIMSKWFVHKFLDLKFMKDVLSSHIVNDANHKIKNSLSILFTVLGWISVATGIIGIFSFLVSLSGLWFMFSLWFGIGVRVLVYVLLGLSFSLLGLFTWIGLIRRKKRVVSLIILGLFVSAILFVVSFIPVGLYAYKSYGSFGGGLFNLIITFVLLLLVVKNDTMFKN